MKKLALITGASGGIGSSVAELFALHGYSLALQYYRNRTSIENLLQKLPPDTPYLLLPCDLTDTEAVSSMVDTMHARIGMPSVIVHSAGAALPQRLFSDTTDEQLQQIFALNVYAPMRLTRLLDADLRQNHASVITISSMWGITGASCEVIYSASKAALIGFTKALAKELAPSGINVNCIAPGFVSTQMNAALSEDDVEAFRLSTPLERLGTPQDIAEAVWYLANAKFITGQVLSVDGGIVI